MISRHVTPCHVSGVVLKPDRPVTTTDACFVAGGKGEDCRIYHAWSDVPGAGRARYHFNNNDAGAPTTALTGAMVALTDDALAAQPCAVFNWYTRELALLAASSPEVVLAPGYENHSYAIVAPLVGETGWAFLGEIAKYVPSSTHRFARVDASAAQLTATVVGVAGERVEVCAALRLDGSARAAEEAPFALRCATSTFDEAGEQTVTIAAGGGGDGAASPVA
jgi:hypothetical protein